MLKENEISFEDAIQRLEEIVNALEEGNASLDASLKLFEDGVKLVTECKARLDGAEQKVKMLIEKGNGDYVEEDFRDTEQ